MFSSGLGLGPAPTQEVQPIAGRDYILKLRRYCTANLARLAPPVRKRGDASWLSQSYTLLTLGLDPNSAPLSRSLKVPLTLGFGSPAAPRPTPQKPVLLRLPPDKLLYLLLRWQSLPQGLQHVGHTDVPVPVGVSVAARGATAPRHADGDVESVRSWAGSIRTVSMGRDSWFAKKDEVDEDKVLLELYSIFNALPGLLIHPPFSADPPISELLDAGGYTQLGGVDVRVPLDVLRNLQILELDGFDPRGLLIPSNDLLHQLSVHDVNDGDDWLNELLSISDEPGPGDATALKPQQAVRERPRFSNLRYLSLQHCQLLSFPNLPLTSLTHLDLSHNELNAIPDLSALHHLQSLNLSNNVITSVRNASTSLGNVATINLSDNRIDCLVGLDRVLGLKRVDIRSNHLLEAGEVGRLAVLPLINGVWATSNPFSATEWRADVAATFIGEGREVVLDDTPLSWTEARAVDALLARRGQRRRSGEETRHGHEGKDQRPIGPAGLAGGLVPPSPARATRSPRPPSSPIPSSPRSPVGKAKRDNAAPASVTPQISAPPSPTAAPRSSKPHTAKVSHKKRARRRVNLDDGSGSD